MNLSIVYAPGRIDLYSDGVFSTSFPPLPDLTLPVESAESIEAYVADGMEDRFGAFVKDRDVRTIEAPCLIETDKDLVMLRQDGTEVIPLRSLYSSAIDHRCAAIDDIQRQAGFFPMNQSWKESAANYLFACFQELPARPKVLCVPVFGWFNYALLDESEVDESSVIDHTEIPGSVLFDEAEQMIRGSFPSGFLTALPERRLVRSALLRETLSLLSV